MKEFIIDKQQWRRWPRVLVVRKIDGSPNIEERRYVPESTTTLDNVVEQMREAADLILELRNDLQQANSENAKLRELVRDVWSAYHDGATNREFRALPDRLRELGVD